MATARDSLQTGVQNAIGALGTAVGSATADTVRAANRMAEAVDDTAISAKVRPALATDPALSALKIDVTTREGVVELTGPGTGAAPSGRLGNSTAFFSPLAASSGQLAAIAMVFGVGFGA